jgi:aryl-alcohol dehydrogenase-like predicted oxidoreductase
VLGYGGSGLEGLDVSEGEAERVLTAALDAGINYFDTAIDYGLSEQRFGNYLSRRRADIYLATKCGCVVGQPPLAAGSRPAHVYTYENVVAGIDQSLVRLGTDHLDLVFFHNSPGRATVEKDGAVDGLLEAKRLGKVRHIGSSAWLPNIADHLAMGVFDVFLVPYSLLWREHEEIMDEIAAAGAGVVVRNGAAKGGPGKEEGDYWDAWQQAELDELLDGMSRMEFVIRFTCSHPNVTTAIVGTVNPSHLRDNVRSVTNGPLPADVYAEARRRLPITGRPDTPPHAV